MGNRKTITCFAIVGLLAIGGWVAADNPSEHPEVDGAVTADACDVCHTEVTPRVVGHWFASKHGEMNVKCFVCHGSTGSDFTKKPTGDRCLACHADQAENMAGPFMKDKTCFTCHPAHPLKAHVPAGHRGGAE